MASLTPGGSNYDRRAWVREPAREYHYSVSAYPFLRYLVGHVTGRSYAEYMHENIFAPLGMTRSGFSADEFAGPRAIPYTRIDGENIELPMWKGQGSMMHTTAADMAKFQLALMNDGQYGSYQLLRRKTVELMRLRATRFKVLFKGSDDLPSSGHGLGVFAFRGGWYGHGGSAPGFQCLSRYHPTNGVGYVILSNVNAILGGGTNYESARSEIYDVQDALVSILDPMFGIRHRAAEIGIVGALMLYSFAVGLWLRRRKARRRSDVVP